jgi:hypothetical protein
LHVAVELDGKRGAVLVLITDRDHDAWLTLDNRGARSNTAPVLPSHVAAWINHALGKGWCPEVKGPQFVISVE